MNEDKIIETLFEHGERLDRIEQRLDGLLTKEHYAQTSDQMMVILKRIDEERYTQFSWIERIDNEVKVLKVKTQSNENQISRVKKELHIA